MEKHILKQEDFTEIFSEIVFFKNSKNKTVEIGYVEYFKLKSIKFYIINGEIFSVEGNIFINKLNKIQKLLIKLDIRDLD